MRIEVPEAEKVIVKIGTVEYDMAVPTLGMSRKLQEDAKDKPNDIGLIMDFVEELGLPKEVVNKLTNKQLQQISNGLMFGDDKKK